MNYNSEDNTITVQCQNAEIEFAFDGNTCDLITVNNQDELSADNDALHGLLVLYKGQTKTLYQLMIELGSELPSLRDELEQEAADNAYMAAELSSPYYSGRV